MKSEPSIAKEVKNPVALQNWTLLVADGLDKTTARNINRNIAFNKSNEIKRIIIWCLYNLFLWSIARKKYMATVPESIEILDGTKVKILIINTWEEV